MTLVELCEPLFQYICRLSRGARKGVSPDMARVRGDIKGIFGEMTSKAHATPALEEPYRKIEIVLMYFVDFMVKEGQLAFARNWQELAYERNMLAGDQDFFDELDQTLAEPVTESTRQRLSVFYTCLGLGFTGWYTGNPEHLRSKMNEIVMKIHGMMDPDKTSRVCPEAYEHVNTADLVEPPTGKLIGVAILIVGLTLTLFAANVKLYLEAKGQLDQSIKIIKEHAESGVAVVK